MATFKLLLHSANKRKNGSYPVSLRITKNMKHKYISLGLYGKKEEWDEKSERFRCDKRVCPNYKEYNARLVQLLARVQNVELDFEHGGQCACRYQSGGANECLCHGKGHCQCS